MEPVLPEAFTVWTTVERTPFSEQTQMRKGTKQATNWEKTKRDRFWMLRQIGHAAAMTSHSYLERGERLMR